MISVLIPYYNWDIGPLVNDLLLSARNADVPLEIVTCDDCSTDYKTSIPIANQQHVEIVNLLNETNLGRSATRNRLVDAAKYDIIIFIDGDSRLQAPESYLSNYFQASKNHNVIIGGTTYDPQRPTHSDFALHWHYGRSREAKMAKERLTNPARYFFTNNFCCKKQLFEQSKFDEEIQGYGYEDSDWATRISKIGIEIYHIDNNVIHKGLKSRVKFLADADTAVSTLALWYKSGKKTPIELLERYRKLKNSWFGQIVVYFSRLFQPLSRKLLLTRSNNLFLYDLYRLGRLDLAVKSK